MRRAGDRPRLRLTLAGLLAGLLLAATGFAIMREPPSPILASAIFSLTMLVLLAATLGAVLQQQRRAAWLGFAMFGWAWIVLTFSQESVSVPTPITTVALRHLSAHLYGYFPRLAGNLQSAPELWSGTMENIGGRFVLVPETYVQSGSCWFALVIAWCGSFVGKVLVRPRAAPSPASTRHRASSMSP